MDQNGDMAQVNLTNQPENLVKPLVKKSKFKFGLIVGILIMAVAGIFTGYLLAGQASISSGGKITSRNLEEGQAVTKGTIVGINDEKTFSDVADGQLVAGGIDGEGSHHLERSGGESRNVYLTSSIIDLDPFVGHSVKVWGETFSAQKAGWLMDVGRLKVLD